MGRITKEEFKKDIDAHFHLAQSETIIITKDDGGDLCAVISAKDYWEFIRCWKIEKNSPTSNSKLDKDEIAELIERHKETLNALAKR